MAEHDPTEAALAAVLQTFACEPGTAQAIGAGCIKAGIDDTPRPGSAAMCNEGELALGPKKPENDCTTGAAMAQGAAPNEAVAGCVEPGSERGPTKAEQIGLDEGGIKRALQSLISAGTDTARRIVFLRTANRLDPAPRPEEVRQALTEYTVGRIRENEKGPLFHYHQTGASNLDGILEQGGLISYSEQKKRGLSPSSTGSRPNVVQFTRDKYDKDGNFTRSGLVGGNEVGVDNGVTFVYGDDIMDRPEYDATDTYPSATNAPFDKLHAVVVSNPNDLESVTAKLAAKGVNAKVVTRDQWANDRYSHTA